MFRQLLLVCLLGSACIPVWSQKGGKPKCTNLAGTAALEDAGTRIRSDGLGTYVDGVGGASVVLWTCPGESGDAVLSIYSQSATRRLTWDFSSRIALSPDDPAPSWAASNPTQQAIGGLNIRHILKGYDPTAGYAPGYPAASCWDGSTFAPVCEFTTTATSGLTASDNRDYQIRFVNPNPDVPDTSNLDLQALLNEGYTTSLVRVRYIPNADHRYDVWRAEPVASVQAGAEGKFVSAMFENRRGSITRLGYFDTFFNVTVRRKDGM